MKKILFLTLAIATMLVSGYKMVAQPTVFFTNLSSSTSPALSNSRFALTDLGAFRQVRFQTTATPAPATQTYAFHTGTTGSPNYNPCWRPYNTGDATGIGYALNTIVVPSSVANSARYNTSSGGVDGNLAALANNTYYTVNIQENATADNLSAIWATAFNPVTITSVSQAPAVAQVTATDAVKVFVRTSAAPASGENFFLRYSTNGFTSSTVVQFTFAAPTMGNASIPAQPLSTNMQYYVFSSNRTTAELATLAGTAGILENAYDMATLNFNNNAGANYGYTVVPPQPFITEWITNDGSITIPTLGTGFNYNVVWINLTNAGVGNGSITGRGGDYAITGLENGSTYEVRITGAFPYIFFQGNAGSAAKVRNIKQWGSIAWGNMQSAFSGCANLVSTATDAPNLSNVNDLSRMFRDATLFNSPVNHWNVSNATRMELMFVRARAFNQPLDNWNTEAVTNMAFMFNNANAFNQSLANWNVANLNAGGSNGADGMLDGSAMNTANYDATLISWGAQNVKTSVRLGAGGLTYCSAAAVAGRTNLATGKSWTISGDGSSCINLSASTLAAFSACSGVASVAQSYTVSGSNLTADIVITAPTDFEVSITSATAGFAGSQTLTQAGGNVALTTVYVRQTASAANGATGSVTNSSTGMVTKNVAIPVSVATPAPTITGVSAASVGIAATSFNLVYTGTANAPNQYSIESAGTATPMPGFIPVTNASLTASPLAITIPASAVNTYTFNLTVRNTTTGCVSAIVPFTLTVAAVVPTITNFTPTSGGVDQVLTITGTDFTGATAVTIGGIAARSYTVVNATTITAVVGDNFATGVITVVNGTTATSAALGTPNFTRTSCANTLAALVVTPSNDANGFAGFDLTWTNGGTYTAINVFYQPQSGAGSTYFTRRTFAGTATSGRLSTVNGAVMYNIYIQGVCTGNSERVSTTATAGAGLSCSIISLPGTPLTTTGTDITFTWNTVPNAYLYQPIYQECDAAGNRVGGGQGSTAYLTPAMTATQSWTVSQLKPSTFYRFSVRVHCLQGNSNLISAYSLYPFIQTGAGASCLAPSPTLGAAGETNGYASQVINWASVPSATNGYGIYFRENSQPNWTAYHLGNVLTYNISGLKQGATYIYFVYGSCSNGQNPQSAQGTFVAGTGQANDCNASTPNTSTPISTPPIGAALSWTTTPNAVQAGKLYGIIYNAVSTPGTTYVVYTDNVNQTLSQTAHQGIVANTNYNYTLQTFCDGRLQWVNSTGTFFVPNPSSAEKAPQPPTGGVTPQGLQALAGLVDLQVYPNPTDSKLSVELGLETASKVGIKLTDAAGRVVFNENVSSNGLNFHHAIDMKNLASGVYLLMVDVEGKTTVKRVVKQ